MSTSIVNPTWTDLAMTAALPHGTGNAYGRERISAASAVFVATAQGTTGSPPGAATH